MNLVNPYNCTICVFGLGYVGLPLIISITKANNSYEKEERIQRKIIGFDKNISRINNLKKGLDETNEIDSDQLINNNRILFTSDIEMLKEVDIYILALPTPIDEFKRPDLSCLENGCQTIGKAIKSSSSKNSPIIIFESTVYPGCTDEFCVPIIEKFSGLKHNCKSNKKTFFCGYSPERINPGDKDNGIENIVKIVSGCNEDITSIVDKFYSSFVKAGTYITSSIKVAETAKIIENTQRDINIALVNELAIICDRLEVDTLDVLNAAASKWNFHHFKPGLVGGHCISVDPYYLTHKAQQLGYDPQVVLAGRKINDGMSKWLVDKIILKISQEGLKSRGSSILIMGVTFKENCPDIRNSKVIEIIQYLKTYGFNITVHDPLADLESVKDKCEVNVESNLKKSPYDIVLACVAHNQFKNKSYKFWNEFKKEKTFFFDIKGIIPREIKAVRI